MLKQLVLATGLMLMTGVASAQGIAGRWNASVNTAQGPFALAFEFAAEGADLTGRMSNDFLGTTPISDGKIEGNKLSFKMALETAPGAIMAISFAGELNGDELSLTSTVEGDAPPGSDAEQSFVAMREKPASVQ
jgi:hypothetical protein